MYPYYQGLTKCNLLNLGWHAINRSSFHYFSHDKYINVFYTNCSYYFLWHLSVGVKRSVLECAETVTFTLPVLALTHDSAFSAIVMHVINITWCQNVSLQVLQISLYYKMISNFITSYFATSKNVLCRFDIGSNRICDRFCLDRSKWWKQNMKCQQSFLERKTHGLDTLG